MGGNDDRISRGRDWTEIKFKTRFLIVAAVAVGIVLASPSFAHCPKPSEMFVARNPQAAKLWAKSQMKNYGWNNKAEWIALEQLWTNESNWRCDALNKTPVYMIIDGKRVKFHAGGIPQKLGLNPKSDVKFQIRVGMNYVKKRYGTPVKALAFWKRHYYY